MSAVDEACDLMGELTEACRVGEVDLQRATKLKCDLDDALARFLLARGEVRDAIDRARFVDLRRAPR